MKKLVVLIVCNVVVLSACALEVIQEIQEGFEGVKAHHGLMLYMFAELIIRIKEAREAFENIENAAGKEVKS